MSTRVMARHGSLVTALAVASCLVACGRSDTGSRLRTPFDGLQLAQTSTLPDLTVGGEISANWFSRTSPLQGNVVVVESDLTWAPSGPTAVFLRASNLHLKPGVIINANGQDGGDFAVIAYGGKGGSGGGAGVRRCNSPTPGRGGDEGRNGEKSGDGNPAGRGTAALYNAGFTYGFGRRGGNGQKSIAPGGNGTVGAGGGGGGGGNAANCSVGNGGGGGGGLVVVVADRISGYGTISAIGGDGGPLDAMSRGGAGGGGVIWIATRRYDGNLQGLVGGGFGHGDLAAKGTARIFQISAVNDLTERSFIDRWSPDGPATRSRLPYSNALLPPVAQLGDSRLSNETIDATTHSVINPYARRTLDLSGVVRHDPSGPTAIFLRVETLRFAAGASLEANGANGFPGEAPYMGRGGDGAGGGGMGRTDCGSPAHGGRGGDVGKDGGVTSHSNYFTRNGIGWARMYLNGFDYGSGGDGGSDRSGGGGGGSGGSGGGGGGAGGLDFCNERGGGGGGGGGLVVIVADSISGSGAVRAWGGDGGPAADGTAAYGGSGGGGGAIWIATRTYDGGLVPDVIGGAGANDGTAGTARIFELTGEDALAERSFSDTW